MEEKTYRWWYYIIPPAILSLLTTLCYYPSLHYPFLFDDLPNITNNYEIRFFNPAKMFFANSRWISRLFNQWTYHHWQTSPIAYRLSNLIIHLVIGLITFSLVLTLGKKSKSSFFHKYALHIATLTSALFLLHPVQTQTVTYVTQMRIEGLATLFSLLTILLFTLATQATKQWSKLALYLLTGIGILFAAGTKEIIVVLPVLLLLADWFLIAQGETKDFFQRLPIHVLLAATLYTTYFLLGSPIKPGNALTLNTALSNNRGNILTPVAGEMITPLRYLTSQFRVVLHYLTMFFWPAGITFDYGWKIPASIWSLDVILPFLILLSLGLGAVVTFIRNKKSLITFALVWFFTVVLPRSSIIPSTELVCDYKTYMASFAVFFFISYGIINLLTKASFLYQRQLAQALIPLTLVGVLGIASQSHNTVWSSRLAFWGDVVTKTEPHAPARAYNNYAVGLIADGRKEEAVSSYLQAIKADPTYAEPHINLALQYQLAKEYSRALEHYKVAISLKEIHPEMYNNLGLLHYETKMYDKAKICFETATRLRPYYSKALVNLARIHFLQNNKEEALNFYKRAIDGDFQNTDFFYTHGSLASQLKHYQEAIPSLYQVEKSLPNYKNTRTLLGNALYITGKYPQAAQVFAELHKQTPNNKTITYNYAQSLLNTKQYAKAAPLFAQCTNLPQLPHASLHHIKCLHYAGEQEKAKSELISFKKETKSPALQKMALDLSKELVG